MGSAGRLAASLVYQQRHGDLLGELRAARVDETQHLLEDGKAVLLVGQLQLHLPLVGFGQQVVPQHRTPRAQDHAVRRHLPQGYPVHKQQISNAKKKKP